jgi:hypothetical protein
MTIGVPDNWVRVVDPTIFVQLQLARFVLENCFCTAGIPFRYCIMGAGADIAVGCARSRLTVTGAITPDAELAGRRKASTFGEQAGPALSVTVVKRPPDMPNMET